MTALLAPPATDADTAAWTIGAPRLLAGLEHTHRLDLAEHQRVHGHLPGADLTKLLAHLDHSRVAGRGGAGFDLAAKIRSLRTPRHLIVNGTESEPASHKDRVLMRRTPHLVLDGALAVAAAVGIREVTVAVHDTASGRSLQAAIAERPDARHVRVRTIAGGFVGGEARSVIRALSGGPAIPTGRRTPPTHDGILLGNVETFAQVAILLRLGPYRFGETGTAEEPGTTLLTLGGAVGRPAVVEIPIGTPLGIVLTAAHAESPQAVIVGGYHGAWISPHPAIRLSRAGLAHAGGTFGAGVVHVVGTDTCALGELARVAHWLAGESAKQCGPCVFGLPALARDVAQLVAGRDAAGAAFGHAHAVAVRGACAHPDGAARFVTSGLHHLQDEVLTHRHSGTCGRPVRGHLPCN